MLYIENIILYSLKQINGERTIYSIYHLLNGKKSSQTIQDAHFFSLKRYFRLVETLTREVFEQFVNRLLEMDMIYSIGDGRFLLTDKGKKQTNLDIPLNFLNGWEYHGLTSLFWERLSLFVQVISNIVYQESQYIPIQKDKDIHKWLKNVIGEMQVPRAEVGKHLYSEMITCLEDGEINPFLIIPRLTGYRQIGLTALQTAKRLNMELMDYHLEFINGLHYMIQKIGQNSESFYLLSYLLKHTSQHDSLTLTARKSYELLQQGYTKEQIANIRNLKLSTIEDHLVELALNVKEFSIDDYVDHELQNQIINVSRQSSTKQLKVIRNALKTVSYFQIRLVLAKRGDR
jgi:uncharacterized protein YpbB